MRVAVAPDLNAGAADPAWANARPLTVTLAEDGTTAMRLLETESFDIMLADLRMPGGHREPGDDEQFAATAALLMKQ